MLVLIPYGVDVPLDRRPLMNWLLIAGIVATFALQVTAPDEQSIRPYVLDGWTINGLFGHMFLHGGIVHLAGNMLFLWVFGNAVCSKVGNLFYLPVFLFYGLLAAATHLIFDNEPAVGASGAINGIIGMYLIFYCLNDINCLFVLWFFMRPYVRTFSASSFWIILLWLFFDIFGAARGGGNVAYYAHLGGFAAGALTGTLLCFTGMVKMQDDERSLVQICQKWNQSRLDDKLQRQALKEVEKAKRTEESRPLSKNRRAANTTVIEERTVKFACPCGQRIKAPAQYAGKQCKCPKCFNRVLIPDIDEC